MKNLIKRSILIGTLLLNVCVLVSCRGESSQLSDETTQTSIEQTSQDTTTISDGTEAITTTITIEDTIETKVQSILDNMSLEEKIYQMFIVTPEDLADVDAVTQVDETTKSYLESYPVGGIIYFAYNLESDTQTKEMLSTTQQYMKDINGIGLFMCVDEEGGKIARVSSTLGTTQLQPMEYYGENANPEEAYNIGVTLATDISQFGFNVDFAPVSDVDLNINNGLHEFGRCFSSNPQTVALMTENVVKGIQDNNVGACIKHFPGLGSTDADTHDGSVFVERTKEQFQSVDFIPIKSGIDAGVDFVMVSHMTIENLSDGLPCDLSKTIVTDWLRNELNFNGIAITDSHQMGAISSSTSEDYSNGKASVMAIKSGIDIVLMPEDLNQSFEAVYQSVVDGEIPESRIDESVTRILLEKEKLNLLS
ncbi:MAG: glycoside hydrolase family 3 protein [Oscillospiraceae bacterium]